MNNDYKLIFEAYALNGLSKSKTTEDIAKKHGVQVKDIESQIEKGIQVEHEHTGDEQTARKIAMDHVFEDPKYYDKLSEVEAKSEDSEAEDLPTRSHEIIAAIMPKDINIKGKKNEDEFFNKAFPYVAKIIFDGDERRAQRYMYYDEDFNSDLISTYSYFQKNGFPKLREQDVERINRKMHGTNEETPQQYAKDMEKDYTSQKIESEDAEMPASDFNKLKQHINKGPIQIKKPSKELPYTHKYIHGLAKQDPREGQKEENAEDQNTRNWINIFHRTFGPGYKEEMEKSGQDPYKFFVDYYIAYLKNPEIVNKFAGLYNVKYPSHQVDLKRLHKEIDEIKDKPIEGYRAPSKNKSEQEERRLDAKCWKGYHKQGTKLKDGVRVNNCVKNK
jgi:hypothetical protein